MDGNLLDSESADTTLAKDWSLPVLPEGNSSLPSSSQELADIFGTSDDEDDMDFPFNLNTGLHVTKGYTDIDLSERDRKSFGGSLLSNEDSGLFLNSFQPPTSEGVQSSGITDKNVPTSTESDPVINNSDETNEEPGDENLGSSTTQQVVEEIHEKAVKDESKPCHEEISGNKEPSNSQDTPIESVSLINEEEGSTSLTKQPPTKPSSIRKSARLQARFDITDSSSGSSSEHETKEDSTSKASSNTNTAETKPHLETIKEESKVDSLAKNTEVSNTVEAEKAEGIIKENESLPRGDSENDSGDETSEDESEDPDKLYCICRQPHDDRFMICCDTCEDWFHGNCVGITVAQGKRMEREGKEYVCPLCLEKEQKKREEKDADRSTRQNNREVVREKIIKNKLAGHFTSDHKTILTRRRTLSGSTPHHTPTTPTDSDAYGLSQLFIPDNAPKGAAVMEEVSSTTEQGGVVKTEDTKVHSNELLQQKCMISDCENMAIPPAIYCGQPCIEKHVAMSLKKLANQGVTIQSSPSEFVRGSGGIGVIDKSTNKIMVGICAPSEKELIPWLQVHPSYQVLIHPKGGLKGKSKTSKVKQESKKDPGSPTKYPKIALMDPDSVRANAKKALYQILWKRCENAPDLSDLDQAEVERTAHNIEEKLHNLYQDINPKYKNKYRSLIFNLKDIKNQGLFRKVLRKTITAKELVRLSTEKLASDDLAAWREHTLKKNLQMIKQREEEAGMLGDVIRKVTHKGEVEIDSSEISDTVVQETDTLTEKPETEEDDIDKSQPHSQSKSSLPSSKTADSSSKTSHKDGGILDLLTNTTSQHGTHIYDQHCDICTGKVKAPPTPPTPPQSSPDSRMEASTEAETTEHTSPDSVARPLLPYSPIVSSKTVIWKGFVSMIGLAKFAAIAFPVSGLPDDLSEMLSGTLQVKGRIAHAQVWDYLDKLRSSSSKEILVIQFKVQDEEQDAYVSMFNYLVRKHRCGVITSSHEAIKDMYLIPLPSYGDVPQPLLPFNGPGLPVSRGDMLLGVIVCSKSRKLPHRNLLGTSPSPVTQIRAEVTLKRHHSTVDVEELQRKRTKFQNVDQTPPSGSKQGMGSSTSAQNEDDESAPYSPSNLLDDVSALDSKSKTLTEEKSKGVQMSFYGEHQPLLSVSSSNSQPRSNSDTSTEATSGTSSVDEIITSAMAASLKATLNLPPTTDIKNILAQLSSEKLKELATAVSSLEKISEGGPPLDPSLIPGRGLITADVQPSNSSSETNTPPPVSQPLSVTDVPQQSVTQSNSNVATSSSDSVSAQMTTQFPAAASTSEHFTSNAQEESNQPSLLIHGQIQEPVHQTQPQVDQAQGTQPQLHQAQDSQPQLHQAQTLQPQLHQAQGSHPQLHQGSQPQAQGSQPQLHQTQGSHPQHHQAHGTQPQLRQAQNFQPQVHDSQTQYHPDSQQRGDNANSYNQWDPRYNQSYNHYPQHSLDGQQGFQQKPNYQQEHRPQRAHDLSRGPNDSNPKYPPQLTYSHTSHQPPPSKEDMAYQQQGQHTNHGWQDPHSAHQHPHWGHQEHQQYPHEHMPYNEPQYEGRGNNDGFHGQPGFRGGRGYRGHGFHGGRRGRWFGDNRRNMDRGDRYRGYHGRGREM